MTSGRPLECCQVRWLYADPADLTVRIHHYSRRELLASQDMENDSLWHGWSKKQQDDGTPGDRYATCHCPVIVHVRRTHDGTLARGVVQATEQTMRHV